MTNQLLPLGIGILVVAIFASCASEPNEDQRLQELEQLSDQMSQALAFTDTTQVPTSLHENVLVRTLGEGPDEAVYIFVRSENDPDELDYYIEVRLPDSVEQLDLFEDHVRMVNTEAMPRTFALFLENRRIVLGQGDWTESRANIFSDFETFNARRMSGSKKYAGKGIPFSSALSYPRENSLAIAESPGSSTESDDHWLQPKCQSPPCAGGGVTGCVDWCLVDFPGGGYCGVSCGGGAGFCAICVDVGPLQCSCAAP